MFEIGYLYVLNSYDCYILIVNNRDNEFYKCFTYSKIFDKFYDQDIVHKKAIIYYKKILFLNNLSFDNFKQKIEECRQLEIFK